MANVGQREKLLQLISAETDPKKLKSWMENARKQAADDVYQAAFRKLCSLSGRDLNDPLDREFQEVMSALETALTEARGRTTRLNRTRQKLSRVGVRQLLSDLAVKPSPSDGFLYLLEFGMADMSAESLIVKHRSDFSDDVVQAARNRLEQFNIPLPD